MHIVKVTLTSTKEIPVCIPDNVKTTIIDGLLRIELGKDQYGNTVLTTVQDAFERGMLERV